MPAVSQTGFQADGELAWGQEHFHPQELSELDGDPLWRWDRDCHGVQYPPEQETSQRSLEFNQSQKQDRLGAVLAVCSSQIMQLDRGMQSLHVWHRYKRHMVVHLTSAPLGGVAF